MKKTNDLAILLLVFGLFVVFIGAVSYAQDSAVLKNQGSKLVTNSEKALQLNQKEFAANQSFAGKDKPGNAIPDKIITGIDVLLATGLTVGLYLISQRRVKLVYIFMTVGVLVAIIDIFLRFGFKSG